MDRSSERHADCLSGRKLPRVALDTTEAAPLRRPVRGASVSMWFLGLLVLLGWQLLVLAFAEQTRGDCERGVDERVWTWRSRSAPRLTSGRAVRNRSASAKCSPAALGGCGVLRMGRAPSAIGRGGASQDADH
jgi:hypothetical protein